METVPLKWNLQFQRTLVYPGQAHLPRTHAACNPEPWQSRIAVSRGGAAPWEASMEGGATVMRWCRRSRSSMKRSGKLVRITSSNRRAWLPATPYLPPAGSATSEEPTASLPDRSVRRESARRSTQPGSLICRCLRLHARSHVSLPDRCAICCNHRQDTGSRLLQAIDFKICGT